MYTGLEKEELLVSSSLINPTYFFQFHTDFEENTKNIITVFVFSHRHYKPYIIVYKTKPWFIDLYCRVSLTQTTKSCFPGKCYKNPLTLFFSQHDCFRKQNEHVLPQKQQIHVHGISLFVFSELNAVPTVFQLHNDASYPHTLFLL